MAPWWHLRECWRASSLEIGLRVRMNLKWALWWDYGHLKHVSMNGVKA